VSSQGVSTDHNELNIAGLQQLDALFEVAGDFHLLIHTFVISAPRGQTAFLVGFFAANTQGFAHRHLQQARLLQRCGSFGFRCLDP
jgi:hypothetical protein